MKALVENVKNIPAIKEAPKAEPVAEATAPAAKARQLSISCSSLEKMTLEGKLDEKGGKLVLTDPKQSLALNDSTGKPDILRTSRFHHQTGVWCFLLMLFFGSHNRDHKDILQKKPANKTNGELWIMNANLLSGYRRTVYDGEILRQENELS